MTDLLELGAAPTASEYTELFVLQLYPYASVYVGAEGMLGGEARDRIAGFWRALGESPPAEPDHLAVMLAQLASLVEGEAAEHDTTRRQAISRARTAFFWEHLLCWLPPYLTKVASHAPPTYQAWARLVQDVLAVETQRLDVIPGLPLHLREAPPSPTPRDADREAFLASLLVPVRSGMILTRADLSRAARTTGLALRAGERRFALNALLDQDPEATWAWLESEANDWTRKHMRSAYQPNVLSEFWAARATVTARTLAELRALRTGGVARSGT